MSLRVSPRASGVLLLVLTTLIWGTTFPVLKIVVASVSPEALVALRFVVAVLCFAPWLWQAVRPKDAGFNLPLWRDAVVLGVLGFASYLTQAVGLTLVSSNRAAFITAINITLVPLLAPIFGRPWRWASVGVAALATLGIGIMSREWGALGLGDLWVLGCAVSYALYILWLERVATRHNALHLTATQLLVLAVLACVWAFPALRAANFKDVWIWVVYLGVVATALTTLTQALGQRVVNANQTAIIYALEPVFAAVFAFFLLQERLGLEGFVGAALVVGATLISQRMS